MDVEALSLKIEVSFTPAASPPPRDCVCIVIDALRATSTISTMFARGLTAMLPVGSLAEARRQAAKRPGWLLCGERRSLPPTGFDYGNSPREFSSLDLRGRSAVFVTTNGTGALMRASGCSAVYAGSLLNVSAVGRAAAVDAVRRQQKLLVLCAGEFGGRRFDLEDAYCAGAFVDLLASARKRVELDDEAETALRLYRSFRGSAITAFRQGQHGAGLERVGLGLDVEFCARRDVYRSVPKLKGMDGTLRLLDAARRRALS